MLRNLTTGHYGQDRATASIVGRLVVGRIRNARSARSVFIRCQSGLATDKKTTLASRYNEVGIQQVSDHIFKQIFPGGSSPPPPQLVELARDHLQRHDLLGKITDTSEPIALELPPLHGQTLDEHFFRLGSDAAEPFLGFAKQFSRANTPKKPRKWARRSGWTKYLPDGRSEAVAAPDEHMLVFDTEVLWKESPFAVMACAASPTAWYAWLSPWLLEETEEMCQLIPLGDPATDRIVVGHNVGYDRARIREEYSLRQSRTAFLDTMSLHVAVNGMCSQQRPTWLKHRKNRELRDRIAKETDNAELARLLQNSSEQRADAEEELWVNRSSVNSLRDVAKFHLDIAMDKTVRDQFGELDRAGVRAKLDELLDYCAADVDVTHRVFQVVFPNFLDVCPHPVSFAALRHLSSVILPVNHSWEAYIANAEATYQGLSDGVQARLVALAEKALELCDSGSSSSGGDNGDNDAGRNKWSEDPWLRQLDWSGQEVRMVKGKRKGDPPRPAARQKKPGKPQWYKDLFVKNDAPINLTVRTRITPLLLRLCWDGHPLVWSDKYGWTFRVSRAARGSGNDSGSESEKSAAYYEEKQQMTRCDMTDETVAMVRDDTDHIYFKLPHKDGPTARCTSPLSKGYQSYFEKGVLTSEYAYAKEALEMNASCSYWISARDRIRSQLVVYQGQLAGVGGKGEGEVKEAADAENPDVGFILPQVIPMGTITRRAVENTWLTASNAKKNRVGSELKAMVKAPPGYCFVGADVDSEELWIASVVGDAAFGLHGGNALGFMTLEGTKAAGTDLHSRTAGILGITRNDAKVFNYGRIYGAGLRFAAALLRQFNPALSEAETTVIATRLYAATKGTRTSRRALCPRPFWRGGTESFVFNRLEAFAEQERPRTPVLGAGITEALMSRFLLGRGAYLTSRINWAIQSSGQDYLHLLIVAMDYLIRRFRLDARLAITVHDEIRYLVREPDRYRAAMALQVANLWTRAMFTEQVGIRDLPQACAFFSAVDIDHVLRKEVDMDCVTPSHPEAIAPGQSLDMTALLAKGAEAYLDPAVEPAAPVPRLDHIEYTPRRRVMEMMRDGEEKREGESESEVALGISPSQLNYIRAQITADDQELKALLAPKRRTVAGDGAAAGAAAPSKTSSSRASSSSSTSAASASSSSKSSVPARTKSYASRKTPSTGRKASSTSSTSSSAKGRKTRSVLPYYSSPQLVPMEEPMSVTEAYNYPDPPSYGGGGGSGRFAQVVDSSDDFGLDLDFGNGSGSGNRSGNGRWGWANGDNKYGGPAGKSGNNRRTTSRL